jgi:hypothetical protein
MELINHIKKNYLLQEIDIKQEFLSEKYIKPNLSFLEDNLLSIRLEVDKAFGLKQVGISQETMFSNLIEKHFTDKNLILSSIYPIGECYPITHLIFDYVNQLIIKNDEWIF